MNRFPIEIIKNDDGSAFCLDLIESQKYIFEIEEEISIEFQQNNNFYNSYEIFFNKKLFEL